MAHPLKHAESSVRKFGGRPEDYLPIHNWFDESKAFIPDFRHRALRHHAEGIFLAEKLFGVSIVNSDGKIIPVRYVENSMSGRILAVFPQPKIGCLRSSRGAGCTDNTGMTKTDREKRLRHDRPQWPCT